MLFRSLDRDQAVAKLVGGGIHRAYEQSSGLSLPAAYAMIARDWMNRFGTPREALAMMAVQSRAHALLHPNSQMKHPLSMDEVMSARPVAEPFGLFDCCLISDAAGAVVVTSAEFARDLRDDPIYLRGFGECHTHMHYSFAPDIGDLGIAPSGQRAFAMAGLQPQDIDHASLYDCFTIVPLLQLAELGFCAREAVGEMVLSGQTGLGGRLPVNTHGGMLSHAHAGAVGGLLGVIEAVAQLRGGLGARQVPNARHALVHSEGGVLSAHSTLILGKDPS